MPTILNNAQSKALTTLARVKSFLGISQGTYDSLLTVLINQATGAIEKYTGRRLLNQAYSNEEYDGTDTEFLTLKQWPVTAFTSLQRRNAVDNTDSWETLDTKDYFWFEDGRIQLNSGVFTPRPQYYRANYTAGYLIDFDNENTVASHTLPFDIEYACAKLVATFFNRRRAEGLSSDRVGDLSIGLQADVMSTPDIKALLDKHSKVSI